MVLGQKYEERLIWGEKNKWVQTQCNDYGQREQAQFMFFQIRHEIILSNVNVIYTGF
jgi:hypothetical protein